MSPAGRRPAGGHLYLVATPIGNLSDVTLRALRVLAEADVIAAEDTRTTRKLLTHHGIHTPLVSYHRDNERVRTPELMERLSGGESVAIVSEAGTPSISDPGHHLVRAAIDAGIDVVPIPGPSAILAAVVASGLAGDAFVFDGFLPRKSSDRRRRLEELAGQSRTLVFFEAPHRLDGCLKDLVEVLGDRPAALCRELTKMHEEVRRGGLAELCESVVSRPVKGEIVIVVEGAQPAEPTEEMLSDATHEVLGLVDSGETVRDATSSVASRRGLSRRGLYDRVLKTRRAEDA